MKNRIIKPSFPTLIPACFICFAASYLSEITLGVVSTIPFILFLPALAYIIRRKKWEIAGLCALSAFITKCIFSKSIFEIVLFTVFCGIFSLISVMFAEFVLSLKHKKKKSTAIVPTAVFLASFVIYFLVYGTFWGNLSSKAINEKYLQQTYPDETFKIGTTYYSAADRCYVTTADFSYKEMYSARFSAKKDGTMVIDGYADLCRSELLNAGLDKLRNCLSTYAYEGEDFVARATEIHTDDLITTSSVVSDYYDKMCYEIGLYYQFSSAESFERMCREYIGHLDGFDTLIYKSITFYGFDTSDSDDFAYTLEYNYGNDTFESRAFSDENYKRLSENTRKHWTLIG